MPCVRVAFLISVVISLAFGSALAQMDTAWVRKYNGPGNGSDIVTDLAVDSLGNVYVTGYSAGSGTNYDYATLVYDTSGELLHEWRYNGPGNGADYARSVGVDPAGHVYATGTSPGDGTGNDWFTVKYNAEGDTADWARRYSGSTVGNEQAWKLALDDNGDVFVTGISTNTGFEQLCRVVKYDSLGNLVWSGTYDYPSAASSMEQGRLIDIDGVGRAHVTGTMGSVFSDWLVMLFDTAGDTIWVRTFAGPGAMFDAPTDQFVDAQGRTLVTGYTFTGSQGAGFSGYDFLTIKYDVDGDTLWQRQWNSPSNGDERARAMAVDRSGNVIVTGDGGTVKYDSVGNLLWEDPALYSLDVVVDTVGNAFLWSWGLWRIEPSGSKTPMNCDQDSVLTFPIERIALDRFGDIIGAGVDGNSGNGYGDYFIVRFVQTSCCCPHQCDYDGDGYLTSLDLGALIDVLFAGRPEQQDPGCPSSRGDFDNDGFPTALDLAGLIDHLFAGGEGPCDPCNPVPSTCSRP